MIDSALITRAVEAGLALGKCACCDGAGYTSPERGGWAHCPACDGTSHDTTLGGLLLAVFAGQPYLFIDEERVGVGGFEGDEPHDGTNEGRVTAALTAFVRAKESTR